jgi:hypothetical protein
MFRISQDGQDPIADVEFEEDIEPVIRAWKPGRYHVDEIRAHGDPFPSDHTSRALGEGNSPTGRQGRVKALLPRRSCAGRL